MAGNAFVKIMTNEGKYLNGLDLVDHIAGYDNNDLPDETVYVVSYFLGKMLATTINGNRKKWWQFWRK